MGLFGSDYSSELETASIIGGISYALRRRALPGNRGGEILQFVPYNLIFTENIIYGGHRQEKNMSNLTVSVMSSGSKLGSDIQSYLSNGNVYKNKNDQLLNSDKIDIKYDKFKKISLGKCKLSDGNGPLFGSFITNCSFLEIDTGIIMHAQYLISDTLFDKVAALLKGTPLAAKLNVDAEIINL